MRAVFVTETPLEKVPLHLLASSLRHRELLAYYPSYKIMPNGKRNHYQDGDRRAAMAPFLGYAMLTDPNLLAPHTRHPAALLSMGDGAGGGVGGHGRHAGGALQASAGGGPGSGAGSSSTTGVAAAADAAAAASAAASAAAAAAAAAAAIAAAAVAGRDVGANSATGAATASAVGASDAGSGDPFKWMLFGDDDTIYWMRGVKALLRDLDPQQPLLLTDNHFRGSDCPSQHAGACRACTAPGATGPGSGRPAEECKCTVEALCGRNFGHNVSACVNLWEGVVPFGGAGFIFSIGFFKQLTAYSNGGGFRAFEGCVHHPFNGSIMGWPEGGDAILSRCLWRMGFPVSVPPLDSPLGTKRFGETLTLQRLYAAAAALSNNSLPEDAAAQWTHGATVHLSVRDFKSYWDAAAAAKMFIAIYDMVAERLWPTKPRNGG
ncbi:hypothetical protein CHLRE_09g413600v5 [Chlamydomonas reinhardtii]|uniref:Uncharacterized protein n=1 Tax=Chlamydomonas reinhardtii TaxID=3055 RepID=A0A2K3DFU0_CHLRE|nr:uncharacterized protein CHLRE_09g413600v5 [Chlamydomonas reinhardtii]PNW79404.1 hypothetical protein CHLRE_09g413600v5 [Chlamydomonas reinhardtii]